jgi:osmotically-inducible protein OsmY
MSKVRLTFGTIALALLTVGLTANFAAGQATAIKDGWLVTKLHSLFVPEDALSGSDIDVDVKAGMVTLQGTVPNEAARTKALSIAKGADGVKGVTDQLRIVPDTDMAQNADKAAQASKKAGRKADDGWIKSKIYAQYMADWDTVLNDSDIDVDVDNGMVTLNGTVKSAAAKAKAVATAKATDGVKGVKDNLKVGATN